ncbi:MAG: 16S rRNA (cytidine(1402)-2'-O)-methyltransferase [Microgenomates group bacterium]
MKGTLFVVATPIGNLQDITIRAEKVLENVDVIACEDTRKTGLLLQRLGISKKARLVSYYEENELRRIPEIVGFLKSGKNVALVSNAGTPTISDPGFKLIRECISQGINIVSVPGPSAVLAALVVSGFPSDKFLFLGYLPKKINKRKKLLESVEKLPFSCTLIIFESPKRVIKLLKEIKDIFGNIEVVIAKELTKLFEKTLRGKTEALIRLLEKEPPRGEMTLLINLPLR